jgi:hypothetical protein
MKKSAQKKKTTVPGLSVPPHIEYVNVESLVCHKQKLITEQCSGRAWPGQARAVLYHFFLPATLNYPAITGYSSSTFIHFNLLMSQFSASADECSKYSVYSISIKYQTAVAL